MIKKNYKYFEIKNFLNQNNFHLKLKLKMNFKKKHLNIYMRNQNKNLKASIIVVNYNNSKYINRCINSVKKQTYKNLELIFVDDCSTDNSIFFAKKFKK